MSVDNDGAGRLLESFTQLQELVDKLQKENWSLKGKLKSCSTIGTFYHEARQELCRLNEQVTLKDARLQELQSRLTAYQSSAVLLGREPQLSIGPSASLLDGLLQEISKAKKEQADSARDWQDEKERLKEELRNVQLLLREKERQVELMLGSPQYKKDAEIARLRQSLREKDRLHVTREVWCRSLADETEQLQLRLAGTANMCQQLARQLEEQRKNQHRMEKEPGAVEQLTELQQGDSPEAIISKIQEENRVLKQKVIYVEDLNTKWQKYDIGREDYVKRLHLELKDLRSRLGQPAGFRSPQANADILQQEIARLNRLLEEKMKECECLAGYRDSLEKERAISHQLREQLKDVQSAGGATRERMQMLEEQVLVYKDDFKSERKDRERAQSRIQELEEELARLRLQLPRKQEVHDSSARRHGNSAYRLELDVTDPVFGNGMDRPLPHRGGNTASAEVASSELRHQGLLQCPKCMRLFNDEVSDECLRHISECCQ
ncbi:TNFAIP3-interacting protein 2 [Pristis pectinata]|uniref:TNFAIP3-interacting protein 2 n=1 Tax=Pristis pectinata TaxID=685728 RepID=UPI00223DB5AF|nr:TNFAIP3-interacting protein 2 [Pristis pectinata]